MDMASDPVVAQLRKLREGCGITTAKLGDADALMSALGTSDPLLAYERLREAITRLGDSDRTRALRADFGFDLDSLLAREPASREIEWLGERRSGYSETVGRDPKTIARWSDRAIDDLRAHLISDTFAGHIYVVASVSGNRVRNILLIQEEPGQDTNIIRTSTDFENTCTSYSSLPALIYAFPRDWQPISLTLSVVFDDQPPASAYALVADSFITLCMANDHHPLAQRANSYTCRFENIRRDRLYAIVWA